MPNFSQFFHFDKMLNFAFSVEVKFFSTEVVVIVVMMMMMMMVTMVAVMVMVLVTMVLMFKVIN